MSAPLYNTEILRLAASIAPHARLPAPDGSAELRSPVCGSRVTVDVMLGSEGRLHALGLEVRACALGQASAALMAQHAVGRSAGELAQAAAQLRAMLTGEPYSSDFWPGIEVLARAQAYPARHGAILLPFDAVAQAMQDEHEFRPASAKTSGEDA